MGSYCDGRELIAVGREHEPFGSCFGGGVRTFEVFGVGQRFVCAFDVASRVYDAGCAGVHEPRNGVFSTGANDVVGPDEIGQPIFFLGSPHAGFPRYVEDRVATFYGAHYGLQIGQVTAQGLDASGGQLGVVPAPKTPHRIASFEQLGHDGLAQKAAAAGYQSLHAERLAGSRCLLAQTASFSRPIFALCRASTGKLR